MRNLFLKAIAEAQTHLRKALRPLPFPEGTGLFLVDPAGSIREILLDGQATMLDASERAAMIREAHRWGEPFFRLAGESRMSFALPCTFNEQIVGGIIAEIPEPGEEASTDGLFLDQLKRLAGHLAEILEDSHLLSGAGMREQAARMQRERLRAEAIHEQKSDPFQQIRRIYWELEPELFLAMRRRQRREARRLLNQILMGIYSYSGEALDPTKGFVLELVTMMTRTLAEGGTEPSRLLGSGFDRLRTLENIHDHESLSQWLTEVLEHLIDAAENAPESADDLRIRLIINYMREHCHEPLTRDGVARKIGLSPAHFSRLVRRALGRPFSEELQRIRLRKASRLLAEAHLSIKEIAALCGFNDQSYFTRVFREKHGVTPQSFRKST